MKIVAISDTHCQLEKVKIPDGDILIHAGDLTFNGSYQEIAPEIVKLGDAAKRFRQTILICGNHDFLGESSPTLMADLCFEYGITWLNNSSLEFEGLKIWGSPVTPTFGTWAFMRDRGDSIRKEWDKIPHDTDILVTHGPPLEIRDKTPLGRHAGCKDLLYKMTSIKTLKLHIFGHIHKSYGYEYWNEIKCVNASICNEDYDPVHEPIVSVL